MQQKIITNKTFQKLKPEEKRFVREMVANTQTMRAEWLNRMNDPRKNVEEECRYPTSITAQEYRDMFDRSIGKRVVTIEPEECWEIKPEVYDSEDSDETPFELAFKELDKSLHVMSYAHKIDLLSGIGRYGVILYGLDDGKDLNFPVKGFPKSGNLEDARQLNYNVTFMRALDESLCQVARYDGDVSSPRYGQPELYTIQLVDPNDLAVGLTSGMQNLTLSNVHWTRVSHFADNRLSSEIYGTPRQQDVWNYLLNIQKIAGAAGEGFWQMGFPGVSFESQPGLEGLVELDVEALREMYQDYTNGLQRMMASVGMTAKSMAPNISDPGPHIDVQIKLLCATKGIPYEVFMGMKGSKLGGSDSEAWESWDGKMKKRQYSYITPYVIRPVVDRLVIYGALPMPTVGAKKPPLVKDGKKVDKALANNVGAKPSYDIDWPDLSAPTDADIADVALKETQALAAYIGGNVNQLITPEDYLTIFLKKPPEEVQMIMDNAHQQMGDTNDPETDVLLGGPSPEEIQQQAQQKAQQDLLMKQAGKVAGKVPPPKFGKKDLKGVKNFNPNHDKDDGKFTSDSEGKTVSESRARKLTITKSAELLKTHGYTMGHPESKKEDGKFVIHYPVTKDKTKETRMLTPDQIKEIISDKKDSNANSKRKAKKS